MTTLTKNCSYWFVLVNGILLVTLSIVVIFSTFVVGYYLYLDYSANEFYYTENELKWTTMEKECKLFRFALERKSLLADFVF